MSAAVEARGGMAGAEKIKPPNRGSNCGGRDCGGGAVTYITGVGAMGTSVYVTGAVVETEGGNQRGSVA